MPKPDEELVRRFILSLPASSEGTHHGHPDFRVEGHIFAGLSEDRRTLNLRCDPVNLSFLVQASPEIYRDAWGGKWLGVALSRARSREVMELLIDAWRLAAPKSLAKVKLPPPVTPAPKAGRTATSKVKSRTTSGTKRSVKAKQTARGKERVKK